MRCKFAYSTSKAVFRAPVAGVYAIVVLFHALEQVEKLRDEKKKRYVLSGVNACNGHKL